MKYLQDEHPILSRIENWVKNQLDKETTFTINNCDVRMWNEAIDECAKHNLHQTAYFLSRDLCFVRDRQEILIRELQFDKLPTRTFQFAKRIWKPQNWVVKRNFQGLTEIIPTAISSHITTIVTPRTSDRQPVFLIEKEVFITTTTRYVFWRLINLLQRVTSNTLNAMFLFLYLIPCQSSLSLRTLIEIKPFTPDLELSQINGTLFPGSRRRKTIISRLISLWRGISKSRNQFESEPTGFMERKGLLRCFNMIWNYLIKGFFGSMLILIVLPLLCIIVCAGSITIGILSPIWASLATVLLHLFMIFIYDFDNPRVDENAYFVLIRIILVNVVCHGVLQFAVSLFAAAILCPIISASLFVGKSLIID